MNDKPVNYYQGNADIIKALQGVPSVLEKQSLERKLRHLVHLRASQINGCAFCVKMHTRETREDDETNERLDRLIVWRHVDDFDERERAALAWVEALTRLDGDAEYGPLRGFLREHFSDKEIGALTTEIAMINVWNRLQVSNH